MASHIHVPCEFDDLIPCCICAKHDHDRFTDKSEAITPPARYLKKPRGKGVPGLEEIDDRRTPALPMYPPSNPKSAPQHTPSYVDSLRTQILDLEHRHSQWLSMHDHWIEELRLARGVMYGLVVVTVMQTIVFACVLLSRIPSK